MDVLLEVLPPLFLYYLPLTAVFGLSILGCARLLFIAMTEDYVALGVFSSCAMILSCTSFLLLMVAPTRTEKSQKVHVVDLGVVDKIDSLEDQLGVIVRFKERRIDGFVIIRCWFRASESQYDRMQKQFVPGKKYIMTYREDDCFDNTLVSFYPKQ